jgi:protein gp37
MSLTKSKGNMYDWVTHTHSHLAGECSHHCSYCYVKAMAKRFPNMQKKYSGYVRVDDSSLGVDYGQGKVIFVDHLNDLFAESVDDGMICQVLNHCLDYPDNQYVLQSKNPMRMLEFMESIPDDVILGTTIESNRVHSCMGSAPSPFLRAIGMHQLSVVQDYDTFITIEPILDFDVGEFFDMIQYAHPNFVNIGADSKGHGLDEPTYEKIMELYHMLVDAEIEVRKKINLERLGKSND